jgi:hypothetical protein
MAPLSHPMVDSAYSEFSQNGHKWWSAQLTGTCRTASTTASMNSALALFATGFPHCGLCRSVPLASWRGVPSGSGRVYFILLIGCKLRRVVTSLYSTAPQSRLHSALTMDCQIGISTQNKMQGIAKVVQTPIVRLSFVLVSRLSRAKLIKFALLIPWSPDEVVAV